MLNSSGPNGPMIRREHDQEAKRICDRLYQESGHAHHRLHPREQVRMRPDQLFAWHDEGSERVDPMTGWKWYDTQSAASSSSTGWQPSTWWQSSSGSQKSKWSERYFFKKSRCSAYRQWRFLCKRQGCKHYTQPTQTSHSRTRDLFSCGS